MATHIRVDQEELNANRRFACGIGPTLPEGDVYFFLSEWGTHSRVDCPGCQHARRDKTAGTPLSQLSGRPGHPGYDRFVSIAESWGYE